MAAALLLVAAYGEANHPHSGPDCVEEGVKYSARDPTLRCCEGLVRLEAYRESANPSLQLEDLPRGCEPAGPPDIKVCARCGDGICGPGENRCNCVADCE
jgi:hypothetical protein